MNIMCNILNIVEKQAENMTYVHILYKFNNMESRITAEYKFINMEGQGANNNMKDQLLVIIQKIKKRLITRHGTTVVTCGKESSIYRNLIIR